MPSQIADVVTRMQASVAKDSTVNASAKNLITSLAQQIRDNVDDRATLLALADQLDASQDDLAGAVETNTPSAPSA
jgi:hypothetical protein